MIENIKLNLLEFNTGQIEGIKQNPRSLTEDGFNNAKQSIQDFPEMLNVRALVVVKHGYKYVVIGGNQRLKALLDLNFLEAPCIVVSWSDEQINQFIIKDNLNYGEWILELLSTDWNLSDLSRFGLNVDELSIDSIGDMFNEEKEDDAVEVADISVSQVGDIWLLGNHRLMCGDSTNIEDVTKLMNGDKADLVWTDPPYNVAVNGKAGKILNDDMSKSDFRKFLSDVYANYFLFMRDGAVIYVAHSESERVAFTDEFIKSGFKFSQNLIWVKNSAVMSRQDFNWQHEPILYGWKEGVGHYYCRDFTNTTVIDDFLTNNVDYTKITKDNLIKELKRIKQHIETGGTIINYDRPSISELHPTMKPVGLVELMIGWSSQDDWIVLDLFGGSGTALIASHKLNRKARIMELDPKYCDVIIKRWQLLTGQNAVLDSSNVMFNSIMDDKCLKN